jgi:hypothetical protein
MLIVVDPSLQHLGDQVSILVIVLIELGHLSVLPRCLNACVDKFPFTITLTLQEIPNQMASTDRVEKRGSAATVRVRTQRFLP